MSIKTRISKAWLAAAAAAEEEEEQEEEEEEEEEKKKKKKRRKKSTAPHPHPPPKLLRATFNGTTLASSRTFEFVEGNVYFPKSSVDLRFVRPNPGFGTTFCHWKGHCEYSDVVTADGTTLEGAMWEYTSPYPQASRIKNHVAFWGGVRVHADALDDVAPTGLGYTEPLPSLRDGRTGWEALCWMMRHPPRPAGLFEMDEIKSLTGIPDGDSLQAAWREHDVGRYATRYRWTLERTTAAAKRGGGDSRHHCNTVRLRKSEGAPVAGKQVVGDRIFNLDGPGDKRPREPRKFVLISSVENPAGEISLQPPAAERDAAALALYNDRATMLPHLAVLCPIGEEQMRRRRVGHREQFFGDGKSAFFDLVENTSGALVGTSGFREIDIDAGTAEWGIVVDKKWWRRGVCRQSFDLCCAEARWRGVHTIVAKTLDGNEKMKAFLTKAGMVRAASGPDAGGWVAYSARVRPDWWEAAQHMGTAGFWSSLGSEELFEWAQRLRRFLGSGPPPSSHDLDRRFVDLHHTAIATLLPSAAHLEETILRTASDSSITPEAKENAAWVSSRFAAMFPSAKSGAGGSGSVA